VKVQHICNLQKSVTLTTGMALSRVHMPDNDKPTLNTVILSECRGWLNDPIKIFPHLLTRYHAKHGSSMLNCASGKVAQRNCHPALIPTALVCGL